MEEKAFYLGGCNYFAPAQRYEDFIENRVTENFGKVKPTYLPGVTKSNLNDILPDYITESLKEALIEFDKNKFTLYELA